MANVSITALTAYTDAASTDVLPIVDVSSNVTKKISISDILKATPAGTAALPAIAIDGDPNTGIWSPAADTFAVSTNGIERYRIDSNGRVLIGTATTPGGVSSIYGRLSVLGNNAGNSGVVNIGLNVGSSGLATGTGVGYLIFTDNSSGQYGWIGCVTDGASSSSADTPGALVFATSADGTASPTERVQITSSGLFKVGTVAAPSGVHAIKWKIGRAHV